eukprot:4276093-Pyramimonas_sp.AAC.1
MESAAGGTRAPQAAVPGQGRPGRWRAARAARAVPPPPGVVPGPRPWPGTAALRRPDGRCRRP